MLVSRRGAWLFTDSRYIEAAENTAGSIAIVVLFDAQRITDHADYTAPLAPNEGVKRVYVNRVCAVKDDAPTGALAGRLLRLSR